MHGCPIKLSHQVVSPQTSPLERFRFDLTDDPDCFARSTALCGNAESSLPWSRGRRARHVASPRLVLQANHLGLAQSSQAEGALAPELTKEAHACPVNSCFFDGACRLVRRLIRLGGCVIWNQGC